MQEEKEQKKEIRQLLFLLGSSVVVALLLSIFMINFYGTTGQYIVKNLVLISAALVIGATVRGGGLISDPLQRRGLSDAEQ